MDKILLVNKKSGITTYDLIRDIKKSIDNKKIKIGHTGTLDPFACGLVIILIGRATKLSDLFLNLDKKYSGSFIAKIKTDTADITGNIILENDIDINMENIVCLKNYTYMQVPPGYSAKKINGISAYKLKRNNMDFSILPTKVKIYDFNISKKKNFSYGFIAKVSKGTYIRTLIEDFAKLNNNTIATCNKLKREEIGPFKLAKNNKEYGIEEVLDILNIKKHIIKYDMLDKIKNGVHLMLDNNCDFIQIISDDKLVAIYKKNKPNDYKPLLIL